MLSLPRALASAASAAMIALVLLYRYSLSAALGRSCRFVPSCSQYAITAIKLHGPLRGGWLTVRRLARCHPLGAHGFDPPPPPPLPTAPPPPSSRR